MEERIVRIRIHPVLYRRFKVICAKLDLSIPKQTESIIRAFIEAQETNVDILEKIRKETH